MWNLDNGKSHGLFGPLLRFKEGLSMCADRCALLAPLFYTKLIDAKQNKNIQKNKRQQRELVGRSRLKSYLLYLSFRVKCGLM